MSHDHGLRRVRQWPRWVVVPIGLGLAALAVVLGLLLEPAASALAPGPAEPKPTLPAVAYGRDLAVGCHNCHFFLPELEASADDPFSASQFLIDPTSVHTPHGSLGCVACHGGDGQAPDKDSGHRGLYRDVTEAHPRQCIICHSDLPNQLPGDELLIPHQLVEDKIVHGEPGDLFCSDCHGAVGHGFDPVTGDTSCSMMVCVDCHTQQESCQGCHQGNRTKAEMSGCDVCHEGPHDVVNTLTCPCCHTSLTTWEEIDSSSHPVELAGKHAEAHCFDCHQYPDFRGLYYVCVDCHESGHTDWGDEDCTQCHDPGATWDIVAATWDRHIEHWYAYKGDHLQVQCQGCHFETYTGLDPNCDACHALPDSHDPSSTKCWLCH